jgi:actin related protein 2/3 complex subunit 2
VVHVSISWSVLQTLLKQGAQAKLQKEYGAFLIAAEAGYDITLKLDTAKITAEVRQRALRMQLSCSHVFATLQQKPRLPFHFAMLKRNVFAAPFADYFDACAAKKDMPTLGVKYRSDESVYLKTEQDRCIVVFNVHFVDKDDQLLGKVFIEEFVHARKSLAAAPSCSFSLVEPPRELQDVKGLTSDERQGFVSFVLHPAHQAKRANTISNIQIFRNYLHYHIKCTKAYMHTRMRTRVRALLQVLNRAKVEPFVKAEKKVSWSLLCVCVCF